MIAGRSIGIVANQPQALAGTLDIGASQKGARFVAMCDAFNLPLVTFVDTSGFYPGKDLEWRGMIRYGAQMAFAYARARVPRPGGAKSGAAAEGKTHSACRGAHRFAAARRQATGGADQVRQASVPRLHPALIDPIAIAT